MSPLILERMIDSSSSSPADLHFGCAVIVREGLSR